MGKHLVLIGAGHVHLTVLKNLSAFQLQGHSVTVISASAYHYYSGMGPGLLSGLYRPQDVRFHVKKMVEENGGTFLEDRAVRIDPDVRRVDLQSGRQVTYDVLSLNTGSYIPQSHEYSPAEAVFPVKPIENLLTARNTILQKLEQQKHITITVAGGGAAGVEMAANVRTLVEYAFGQADIHLVSGKRLLHRFVPKVRTYTLESLKKRQITVKEGARLESYTDGMVELSDGSSYPSDVLFLAIGTQPSPMFADSGLPTGEDDGLLVNEHLQSVSFPDVFGGGDCIRFQPRPLDRVGVYAVRQNPILLHNLLAALNEDALQAFSPQKSFMLILNMGDRSGIVFWNSHVFRGKLFFWLKDYIDTAFMRKFQVSGEREET